VTLSTQKTQNNKASSMAELMAAYSSKFTSLKKGDIVEGTIKKLTPKEITMDIGAKSDALVLEFDRKNVENLMSFLKVGDKVKASVLFPESEGGFPVVSLRRTLENLIYSEVEEAFSKGDIIEIDVLDTTKGGFFAQTAGGIRGFLPNSQVMEEEGLSGKKAKAKVIEFDKAKKRVIFSEKATFYLTDSTKLSKYVKRDDVVDVTVSNIASHGLYVSLDVKEALIEGFIHISEISYQRVEDISQIYKKGDKIKAQVLDIDYENRRVNLSVKRLEKDSFEDIKQQYKKEQTVSAKVTEVRSRGITLEIKDGVIGFIQSSKIPSGVQYKEGDVVEAEVSDFDSKHRMIVLVPMLKAKPVIYR